MTIFDNESAVTILVETVLWAKMLERSGEIETSEADDMYDFSYNCARIAKAAYLEEERAAYLMMHEECNEYDNGFDSWELMYKVIDQALRETWGRSV